MANVDFELNLDNFEYMIERAIYSNSFIEAVTLIHNTIELYLKYKIKVCLFEKDKKQIKLKEDILENKGKTNFLKYYTDYSEICYLFNLITEKQYNLLIQFNTKRNDLMHKLFKTISKKQKKLYSEFKETARFGRSLQLELSPITHSTEDIKRITSDIFDELINHKREPKIFDEMSKWVFE